LSSEENWFSKKGN